jgi:hypothetical protein
MLVVLQLLLLLLSSVIDKYCYAYPSLPIKRKAKKIILKVQFFLTDFFVGLNVRRPFVCFEGMLDVNLIVVAVVVVVAAAVVVCSSLFLLTD